MRRYRSWIVGLLLLIDLYFVLRLFTLATVLLMAFLLISSVWLFIYSPRIWRNYQAQYRRASTRRKHWLGKPDVRYFYLNRYVAAPLLFLTGLLSAYLAWRLNH